MGHLELREAEPFPLPEARIAELERALADERHCHAATKLELANIRSDLARYERLYHELSEARLPSDQQQYLLRKRRLEVQQETYSE